MDIQELDDYEKKVDPRIRSFMTEVDKEITQKSRQEKQVLEQSQRRIEVEFELSKIRDLEKRIDTQNKLASMTIDKLNRDFENSPKNTVKLRTVNQFNKIENFEETK